MQIWPVSFAFCFSNSSATAEVFGSHSQVRQLTTLLFPECPCNSILCNFSPVRRTPSSHAMHWLDTTINISPAGLIVKISGLIPRCQPQLRPHSNRCIHEASITTRRSSSTHTGSSLYGSTKQQPPVPADVRQCCNAVSWAVRTHADSAAQPPLLIMVTRALPSQHMTICSQRFRRISLAAL